MALADQSTEKLQRTRNILKGIFVGYAVLAMLSAIILAAIKGKPVHFMSITTFTLVMLPVIINLHNVRTELKSRARAESGSVAKESSSI